MFAAGSEGGVRHTNSWVAPASFEGCDWENVTLPTPRTPSAESFAPLAWTSPAPENVQVVAVVQRVGIHRPTHSPTHLRQQRGAITPGSLPSRVRFAASRPGPLRADLERRAVHEGKGGGRAVRFADQDEIG